MSPSRSDAETACIEVFREQRAGLWQFFLRGTSDPQTAEDLVQEVLLRVWNHRADLGHDVAELPAATRRYLWRVARNLMIDEIRCRQRARARQAAPPTDRAASEPIASNPGPAATVEHEQGVEAVRQAVRELPQARTRRCMQLWLEDRGMKEIAEEMKLGLGQVRGLLQRGKSETLRRAAGLLGLRLSGPVQEEE